MNYQAKILSLGLDDDDYDNGDVSSALTRGVAKSACFFEYGGCEKKGN